MISIEVRQWKNVDRTVINIKIYSTSQENLIIGKFNLPSFPYFSSWNPYLFIYLQPEKGTPEPPHIVHSREYPPPQMLEVTCDGQASSYRSWHSLQQFGTALEPMETLTLLFSLFLHVDSTLPIMCIFSSSFYSVVEKSST